MQIAIQNSKGELRYVQPNEVYKLASDETVVGSTVNLESDLQLSKELSALQKAANAFGVSLDQFITIAAKTLGISKCSACYARGRVLQRMGELGFAKALWLIWKSMGKTEEDLKNLELD